MYFEQHGKANTEETLRLAKRRVDELGIKEIVIASTTGESAFRALEIFDDAKLTVVTYHCGFGKPFENIMRSEAKKELMEKGASVISATHALSGIERSIAKKHSGIYPILLVADILRLFGQGVKVAVEIAVMASDGGALTGADIVSIGGSARGSDAALVIKPSGQSDFFDLKVREIICKPRDF